MKKILITIGLLTASIVFAWHGNWAFTEVCNQAGTIDVTASYTASDNLGGTVQYTSAHTNLSVGAVVTTNLVEDNGQASTYTVINIHECSPPTPPPTPTPTPNPPPPPPGPNVGVGNPIPPPSPTPSPVPPPVPTPIPSPNPTPPPIGKLVRTGDDGSHGTWTNFTWQTLPGHILLILKAIWIYLLFGILLLGGLQYFNGIDSQGEK